ncbi:MAG: FAD-dependent oxidoreductase, partial [Bacteroidetes bacterium]
DARLTIEVIKTAARQGALCLNYLSAEGFCYEGGRVCGVQVRDELQGQAFELRSRYVVSAAGPWVDRLRKLDHSLRGKHLFHSKGVHLAVPHQRLPLRHAVYFDVPDGRMLFAIPRERVTYLGTTDTPYHGSLECVEATLEDAEYILRGVNHIFPDARLRLEDVESSWAGLRPLIFEEGKKPSEMSRRDEIFESPSGLLSIAGGKLTGYRLMAKKVVDRIARRYRRAFRRRFEPCRTHRIPLHPQPFADYPAAQAFAQTLHPRLQSLELDTSWATYLVHRYGPDAAEILRRCEAANLRGETGLIQGEVRYGVEREGVCTALDFYERRSGRLFFHLPSIAPTRGVVLEELAACLGWNEERLRREATRLDEAVERATTFLPEAAQRPA